jgi:2-iminobutanoate/2-iminopropanoate deaminase
MTSPGHDLVLDVGAKGPYSSAIESNGTLYLAGQGGFLPTGEPADGIRAQTRATLENIDRLLAAAQWSRDDLVSITCYLVDIDEWPALNEEYAAFFAGGPVPTRTAVGVAQLPFGLRVEMTCIASRSGSTGRNADR